MSKAAQQAAQEKLQQVKADLVFARGNVSRAKAALKAAKAELEEAAGLGEMSGDGHQHPTEAIEENIGKKTTRAKEAIRALKRAGKAYPQTFWDSLEQHEYGPFVALNMYRNRGGHEYTEVIQQARFVRTKDAELPWHWLECYNRFLDLFRAHQHADESLLQNDLITGIAVNGSVIDELDFFHEIYNVCSNETDHEAPPGISFLRVRFIQGIYAANSKITSNQCDFLVPLISAHFIWVLKKSNISVSDFYVSLNAECARESPENPLTSIGSPITWSLRQYAKSFIQFASAYKDSSQQVLIQFGTGEQSDFHHALQFFANQEEADPFYIGWSRSPQNNVDAIKVALQAPVIASASASALTSASGTSASGMASAIASAVFSVAVPGKSASTLTKPRTAARNVLVISGAIVMFTALGALMPKLQVLIAANPVIGSLSIMGILLLGLGLIAGGFIPKCPAKKVSMSLSFGEGGQHQAQCQRRPSNKAP